MLDRRIVGVDPQPHFLWTRSPTYYGPCYESTESLRFRRHDVQGTGLLGKCSISTHNTHPYLVLVAGQAATEAHKNDASRATDSTWHAFVALYSHMEPLCGLSFQLRVLQAKTSQYLVSLIVYLMFWSRLLRTPDVCTTPI